MDIKKILFKTNSIDVEKALPDAIMFISRDGKIQWVTDKATELFNTSRMHLLTSNIIDFIENALNMIKTSLQSENTILVKSVAKEEYYEMLSKEIDDGYVLSFRNATSRDLTLTQQKDVETVNRDKNYFILKLANDLKSPLQSIVGFSQAMADGLGGSMTEQQEKYIKIIRKNSSDLMYFVTKLLELSDSEFNQKIPDFKTFDVISTVNSVVRFNEQLYKGKDIRWITNIDENVKNLIYSDENIFKSALQNVLEVMLKSIDMGEVVVSMSIPDDEFIQTRNLPVTDYVHISISSTSLLLSENDLECMFDPYKIIDTANRKNVLRAMTLACVKSAIQVLNGAIWVESKILKNTSFNIIVPIGKN